MGKKKGSSKIRDMGHDALVRKLLNEGQTYEQIAAALKAQGCVVSASSVGNYLEQDRADRREAIRAVAQREAEETVPYVTGVLKKALAKCDERIGAEPDNRELTALVRAAAQVGAVLLRVTEGEGPREAGYESLVRDARAFLKSQLPTTMN